MSARVHFLHTLRRYTDPSMVKLYGPPMSTPPQRAHSNHRKRLSDASQVPAIVIEDLSLSLDYLSGSPLDLSGVTELGVTPLRRPYQPSTCEDSPKSWLDEHTLVSTPRTLPKSDEGKWISGSSSLYTPTAFASKTSASKSRRFFEVSHAHSPRKLSADAPASADVTSPKYEQHVPHRQPSEQALGEFPGSPINKFDAYARVPSTLSLAHAACLPERRLRRSPRRRDLRSAYHGGTELFQDDATRRQARAVISDDGAGSFEYQLTLALLSEMDRATGGRTTHPRGGAQTQSGAGGKGILRNLGTLMNAFGSHRTTGVVQILC